MTPPARSAAIAACLVIVGSITSPQQAAAAPFALDAAQPPPGLLGQASMSPAD
jgi:hypothetical protein